ncbi:MAG: DinB family protein [Saprospiraceae bacterium]|nr:DinB family protein [Saprospiraceae bacterium]
MRQTRENYLSIVQDLDLDRLNHIPEGFANNLVWNYGHIVVTLPLLTYGLSGLPLPIDADLIGRYRRGTRPEAAIDTTEWETLQELSTRTLLQVESDYQQGVFEEYKSYKTTYGYELASIDDAIQFAPVHEGLHLGYAMAMLRKLR